MKKLYIVANWKSNKTELEAKEWLQSIQNSEFRIQNADKEIVVCPSFTLLPALKSYILSHKSEIKLGAQDISPFGSGAYTGEVNGEQIKEFADYVIIGHSERRKYFGETDEMIAKKIIQATGNGLTPIICISRIEQIKNLKLKIKNCIVAYEPLFAVGSGKADTPENANQKAEEIKKIVDNIPVLYGGSVTESNVKSFTSMPFIDGVLIGGASLNPLSFAEIIRSS
ncbi:MAG: triose-phosphate isomerase [Patescibacteria group bacterium]|nr:triose-phosphate isomerase [Patescibacteria group bacterium]